MTVTLHAETGQEVVVPAASVTSVASDQFDITLPTDLKPGCWNVQVQANKLFSNYSNKFAVEPSPTLDSAVLTKTSILVTGTDLVDFSHCGDQRISFQFLPDATAGAAAPVAVPLTVLNWNNGKPVLSLPAGAAKTDTLKGKVQVLLNGNLITAHGETELKMNSQ